MITKLTPEELKTWLPLPELAQLLQVPSQAIRNVIGAPVGCVPALLTTGFPPAAKALHGSPVWNRGALLAHLGDPARKQAARKVILEQGLVGMQVRMVSDEHLARMRAKRAADSPTGTAEARRASASRTTT